MLIWHYRLMHALNALGDTPDTVADRLLAGGWRGLREDGLACPVSNYLLATLPTVEVAAVSRNRISVVTVEGDQHEATLPEPVAQFVSAFDGGAYDQLADQ